MTAKQNIFPVIFHSRDFRPIIQPCFYFKPLTCSWLAAGGPDRAVIAVDGDPRAMASLGTLLGSPLTLSTPAGDPLWWGYLNGITFQDAGLSHRMSLDGLANRVAVLFTRPECASEGGGCLTSQMTTWAEDTASLSIFGSHERILKLGSISEAHALSARDAYLASHSRPGIVTHQKTSGEHPAILDCCGWHRTLAWRTYACETGYLGNPVLSPGTTPLGTPAIRKLAQSFTLSSSWAVARVGLRLRKVGTAHVDQFKVELSRDSSGLPGVVLATALVAPPGNQDGGLEWVDIPFTTPVALTAGVTCWLVVSRSGSPDDMNYYLIDLDEELEFYGGVFKVWNGSSWAARSPDADLVFTLNGSMETTDQMVAIVANAGQFLAGVRVENASGIFTTPWRSGSLTALEEIEALLALGDFDGRELLARVDCNRVLVIERKPLPGVSDWQVLPDRRLVDQYGVRLPGWQAPVGRWLRDSGWTHAPAQPLGGGEGAGFVKEWEYHF
jgi:hypothetical protein